MTMTRTFEAVCTHRGCDADVEVEYRIEGSYLPAMYLDPPETPDVIVEEVWADCGHAQDVGRLLETLWDRPYWWEED